MKQPSLVPGVGALMLSCTLMACAASAPAGDNQEAPVYAAAIEELYRESDLRYSQFVLIQRETVDGLRAMAFDNETRRQRLSWLREKVSRASAATLNHYSQANTSERALDSIPGLVVPHAIRGTLSIKRGNVDVFHSLEGASADAPTAILVLSRVGFNADRTQALIYIEIACGLMCGGGEYVLLEVTNGRWRVLQRAQLYVV